MLIPSLVVRIRLKVLYEVIGELIEGFSVDRLPRVLEVLQKGILERQYFEKINIFFLDLNQEKVGEAILTIDWNKHFLYASSEEGSLFHLEESGKSINQQLSEALPKLVSHINKMKVNLDVKTTEVWYTWRNDIYYDESKLAEARTFCGFGQAKPRHEPKWASSRNLEAKIKIDFQPEKLSEFGITIKHFK